MKNLFTEKELFRFIEKEITLSFAEGRNGKAQNLRSVRNSFRTFLRCDYLPFTELTCEMVISYERWLKEHGVSRNSSSFYMRQLRAVYNKALRPEMMGWGHPFRAVYTGIDDTRKRAVDKKVIADLMRLDLSKSAPLALARDLFLLSFYMRGIAYVDLAFLKKENIYRGEIKYLRHKTGMPMQVKLEACIMEILDRYVDLACHDYLLPIITESDESKAYKQYRNKRSYYNKLLKKLSTRMGLSIPLTSYVSRHTWATIARDMNVALPVISAGMGHSSETMTRIYLASLEASTIDSINIKIINHVKGGVRKKKKL